jgi:hypothetical protein
MRLFFEGQVMMNYFEFVVVEQLISKNFLMKEIKEDLISVYLEVLVME